jgi:tryptophan synthase beta chain
MQTASEKPYQSDNLDFNQYPDLKGHFGPYGGQFVAETLMVAIQELNEAYEHYRNDAEFLAEFEADLKN